MIYDFLNKIHKYHIEEMKTRFLRKLELSRKEEPAIGKCQQYGGSRNGGLNWDVAGCISWKPQEAVTISVTSNFSHACGCLCINMCTT